MRVDIITVGNSKGLRLDKDILQKLGNVDAVDLDFNDGKLIVTPATKTLRKNWNDKFKKADIENDLDVYTANKFDSEDWTW